MFDRIVAPESYCLILNREGLDPHNQKELTKVHKIPKFGVYQASFD